MERPSSSPLPARSDSAPGGLFDTAGAQRPAAAAPGAASPRLPLVSPRGLAARQTDRWEVPGRPPRPSPAAWPPRPASPPPGYPHVTLQPGSAAVLLPAPAPTADTETPAEGSRGFGNIVANPLGDVGGWVDARTERLQLWAANLVRRGERTCIKVGTAAFGAAAPTLVGLWWGSALAMGFASPINPAGEKAPALGMVLLFSCFLPPVTPLLGAAAGWWLGHRAGDLFIPNHALAPAPAHDIEAPLLH